MPGHDGGDGQVRAAPPYLSPHCGERSTRFSASGEGLCTAPHPARTFQVLATLSP